MAKIEYNSNNSGGSWWLYDHDWHALAAAGWEVDWYAARHNNSRMYPGGRFLGALASSATKRNTTLDEAIAEWASITGKDPEAEGCECCGSPHSFWESEDDANDIVPAGIDGR